jgi:hypothetical protein
MHFGSGAPTPTLSGAPFAGCGGATSNALVHRLPVCRGGASAVSLSHGPAFRGHSAGSQRATSGSSAAAAAAAAPVLLAASPSRLKPEAFLVEGHVCASGRFSNFFEQGLSFSFGSLSSPCPWASNRGEIMASCPGSYTAAPHKRLGAQAPHVSHTHFLVGTEVAALVRRRDPCWRHHNLQTQHGRGGIFQPSRGPASTWLMPFRVDWSSACGRPRAVAQVATQPAQPTQAVLCLQVESPGALGISLLCLWALLILVPPL